jgi:hypothetical protein
MSLPVGAFQAYYRITRLQVKLDGKGTGWIYFYCFAVDHKAAACTGAAGNILRRKRYTVAAAGRLRNPDKGLLRMRCPCKAGKQEKQAGK